MLVVCLLGIPAGIGAFTFVYAKGFSYLSTDPRACVNCHIMNQHYDAWLDMLDALVAARKAGVPEADLQAAAALHRKAQWRLDFVAAENSMASTRPRKRLGSSARPSTTRARASSRRLARSGSADRAV